MPDNMPTSRMRTQINDNLKMIYDDIAKEGIPERFRILLDQLQQEVTVAADESENRTGNASVTKAGNT